MIHLHLEPALAEPVAAALAAQGLPRFAFTPVTGDASGRRYFRAEHRGRSVMVMLPPAVQRVICPPGATAAEREALGYDASVRRNLYRVDAFVCVADALRSAGLRVPAILFADPDKRFAVIEDLGALDLRVAFDKGYDEAEIYSEAFAMLERLAAAPPPPPLLAAGGFEWPLLDYDLHAMTTEASLFLKHYAPWVAGIEASEGLWSEWRDWCARLFGPLQPAVLTMRDFHSPNIMLNARPGGHELIAIDFQDALMGPRLYDLVSLLEDARRDLDPRVKREIARAAERLYPDRDRFYADYCAIAAQRSFKIIGEFIRFRANGDARYMPHVPRIKGAIDRALGHESLREFRLWLTRTGLLAPIGI